MEHLDTVNVRLPHGLAYLIALIDWGLIGRQNEKSNNGIEEVFCVDCLADAFRHQGKLEIISSQQGSQFTSAAFNAVHI